MMPSSTAPGYPETLTLTIRTPVERLLVEQALLMAQELDAVSAQAEPGQVFGCCEEAAVAKGRELTRTALEATMQASLQRQEKKRPSGPVPVAPVGKTKAPAAKRR